jgi:hypothetical protein
MFGKSRGKIKFFVERLKDYKALELKILIMLKNRNGTLDGVISHLGRDFVEVCDQENQFIAIPFQNIDGVIAIAKEEWKPRTKEEPKEQPIRKSQYLRLGEVDY